MTSIGSVTFIFDPSFTTTSSLPNDISRPNIVNGIDYTVVREIEAALNRLFTDPNTAPFLSHLSGTIFISSALITVDANNASWLSALTGSNASHAPYFQNQPFIDQIPSLSTVNVTQPDGSVTTQLVVNPGTTVTNGAAPFSGIVDLNAPGGFNQTATSYTISTPAGTTTNSSFLRTLFHELAHGVTSDVNVTSWVAARNPADPYNNYNFTGEALAADAENLAYIRMAGITDNSVRVGHNPDPKPVSNSSIEAFIGFGPITYAGNGRIEASQAGVGQMAKVYQRATYTKPLDGVNQTFINHISFEASGPILTGTGAASSLLGKLFDGIASSTATNANIETKIIPDSVAAIDSIRATAQSTIAADAAAAAKLAPLLGFNYTDLIKAAGLTDELSATEEPITGPYLRVSAGNYTAAEQLYLEATTGSPTLLIGASGAHALNVDYRARVDYLVGSTGNDMLIAGTGVLSGKTNTLVGGGGNDVLVGNVAADTLRGGDGNDILIQSRGADVIFGDAGSDVFILGHGFGAQTIDTTATGGVVSLTLDGLTQQISGVEIFVGNDSLTHFIGNGSSVFLEGSAGADFVLKAGDTAVGNTASNVGNTFHYMSADLGHVSIFNRKSNDVHHQTGNAANNLFIAAGAETHMFGGGGDDRFNIGANSWVEDASADSVDTIAYGGIQLHGGVQQWWMEGGTAYWAPFTSLMAAFPVVGAELLATAAIFTDQVTMKFAKYQLHEDGTLMINFGWGLGGAAAIKNYHVDLDSGLSVGRVAVFSVAHDGTAPSLAAIQTFVNLALKAGFGVDLNGFDPLVLDLDGDGLELTTEQNSRVYFEFDSDGFGERTGWVRSDDGFLALDANANGKIDNVTELFGNRTTSGFTMLAAYDLNTDGVIDASDAVYANLRVWRDLDQDGVTDSGELFTLSALGINAISLSSNAPGEPIAVGGNAIARTGSFSWAGGGTGVIADVAFTINETASQWQGDDTVSSTAALLPQLKGFGTVVDLRIAMTGDATLEGLVDDFATNPTTDLAVLKADAEAILYRWAGVDTVVPDAIGSNGFDARKLAFLEAYSGYTLMGRDGSGDPLLTNIDEMEALWADQVTRLTLRLVVQGPMADAFDGLSYREGQDIIVADNATALGDLYARLLDDLPSDPEDALAQWQAWAPLLGAMADGMVRFDNNLVRSDYIAAQLLAAMDGISQPLDFETLAEALGVPNLTIGTSGNDSLARGAADGLVVYLGNGGTDTIEGGAGQDVYIFGQTIGHVTIDDEEAKPAGDRIRFAFLTAADVSLARDGHDLLITVTATGETVRVLGQFADVVPLGSDLLLSTDKGVEEIQFADGKVFEIPEIMTAVGMGTSGNDHMIGTMHSDVFQGGLGNDLLEGGDDADLYVVNAGEGQDVIHDVQSTPLLRAADMLIFGDDIAPSDLVFSRSGGGDDLLITIGTAGQSVLIEGQFAYDVLGYNYGLTTNSRIESFAFRNYGDGWGIRDLQQLLIAQATTDGADETLGFGDDDTFGASAGNDLLIGLDGQDFYYWGIGAGNDTIDEQARYIDVTVGLGGLSLTLRADTVLFGPGIELEDLVFSRPTSADDLVITIAATGETLTVVNQFAGFQTGLLGAQWYDRVEWFQFADNSRISWQDVLGIVTTGGTGNDHLWGDLYADVMDGGTGNDVMSGKGYGDTYIFNLGDGVDVIADANDSLLGEGFVTIDSAPDILQLGAGIDESDIGFSRDGANLILTIGTNGDQITLYGQDDYFHTGVFGAANYNRIEEIHFDGGAVWDWAELNARVIASETTSGNDDTTGFMMADRFEASAGDDILSGGDSGDTYEFGIGSGHDTIRESVSNVLYGDFDTVELGAGILPGDVAVSRDGDDLILTLVGGDTLTIEDEFLWSAGYTWHDVELFTFAGGAEWTKADVQVMLLAATSGNDHLLGFASDDDLDGLAGDDVLEGGDGSDTYHFGIGSGHDVIQEWVTNTNVGEYDRLVFGAGIAVGDVSFTRDENDLVVTLASGDTLRIEGQFNFYSWFAWNDIERFEFAGGTVLTDIQVAAAMLGGTSGNDHLVGTFRTDVLDGGAGDDLLEGGDEADIYVFGLGYGHDEIRESVTEAILSEQDQLRFGPGISLEDLGFARDGNDLVITVIGTSDVLTITDQFRYYAWQTWWDVDQFRFDDGSTLSKEDVQQIILTPTTGADHLLGFVSPDIIDGGQGNDLLEGGDNGDTYIFGLGYGQDEIREWVTEAGLSENDTIQFGAGIGWGDLVFTRDGDDLIIAISGTTDTLTLTRQFETITDNSTATWWDVENFTFADGTEKTTADIMVRLLQGTGGNDHLVGFYANDTLDGGAGDDLLEGGRGNDTYIHNLHGGHDTISDYVQFWGSIDRLVFGAGITTADVIVRRSTTDADDMVLSVGGGDSSVTLKNQVTGGHDWTIDTVEFADGTVWTVAQLANMMLAGTATSGDDTIDGTSGADSLFGGAGNDSLNGGGGDDVLNGGLGNDALNGADGDDAYQYELGGGNDTISDYVGFWGSFNTLQLGAGLDVADLVVTRTTGTNNMILSFAGESGSITLVKQFETNEWGIDEVHFNDGTILNAADLFARYFAGAATSGADEIFGSYANDTISGGDGADTLRGLEGNDLVQGGNGDDYLDGSTGNDILIGGAGNDTMIGSSGDDVFRIGANEGNDIVRDYGDWWNGYGGNDRIELAAGILPTGVTVSQTNSGSDLVLTFAGGGSVTIQSTINDSGNRIEQVVFNDGTIWTHADLMTRATAPTSGNDSFYGGYDNDTLSGGAGNDMLDGRRGNDILVGGTGNDLLIGSEGNDTYRFGIGDGQDVVQEYGQWWNGSGGTDVVELGAGITAADVTVGTADSGGSYVLYIGSGDDRLTLTGAATWGSDYAIETVLFADGSSWTGSSLAGRVTAASMSADSVLGGTGNDVLHGLAGNDTITGRGGSDTLYGDAGNDTLIGDGVAPTGSNLIVNGSFETSGTIVGSGSWGKANSTLPGWTKANSQPFEQVASGHSGVYATDGSYWFDTDSAGGSGSNMDISQTIGSLTAGHVMLLQFDHANTTSAESGAFEVYWNGTLIASIAETGATMRTKTYELVAVDGDNVLRFVGLGSQENSGSAIDNIRLYETEGVSGADTLYGGDGDDMLTGGAGADTLTGGAGADVFKFSQGDSPTGGADHITDFVSGTDKIDLSAIDAVSGTAGNQAFTFIGNSAFSGTAGELRYNASGSDTLLKADLDGDGAADMTIILSGIVTPLVSDFVL